MADVDLTVEQRLSRLEAREAIADLIVHYARGGDRGNDPAIMGPLFADNGRWESEGFAVLEGRPAIERGLAAIAATRVRWSIHYMTTPLITLSEDVQTAACTWYLWELCTMQGPDGMRDEWLGGVYDSALTLTAEGWKFSRVRLDIHVQGEAIPPWSVKKPIGA